jgi:hypothetical protein
MNTKKLTIPLLIVVGIIWYQVFVRVKSNFESDDVSPNTGLQSGPAIQIAKRDSFSLSADYVDPFLKKGFQESELDVQEPIELNNQPPVYTPQPLPVRWPKIQYHGIIKKGAGKHPLVLVTIDGYCLKMREGEAIYDDIIITKTFGDSIQIQMGKHKRYFYKGL